MHPLIQSAIEAAQRGDKNKASELFEQALAESPNDIDALLAFAAMIDEGTRKRQVLNRVLSLDRTNKIARDMMLEMDRVEMDAYRQHSPGISIPKSQPVSETRHSSQDSASNQISTAFFDKPRTFRYPLGCTVILYVLTVISCCGILWFAVIRWSYSFPFLVLFLIMTLTLGYFLATTSTRVETDGKGIRVTSRFRTIEMNWDEITNVKIDPLKANLILSSNIGESAKISTYIQGYRTFMELLQAKRPDLYTEAISSITQQRASQSGSGSSQSVTHGEPISTVPQSSTSTSSIQSQSVSLEQQHVAPPPRASSTIAVEKPLTFRYSTPWLVTLYLFVVVFLCSGLLAASQSLGKSLPSFGLALVLGLTALSVSSKTEVTEMGIRTSSLFSSSNIEWKDITSLKSNSFKKRLELVASDGKTVNISTQVKDYPAFVELLRKKKPELFTQTKPAFTEPGLEHNKPPSAIYSQSAPTPTVTETKTFQKSFFKQYSMSLISALFCILFLWMASLSQEERIAFIAVAGFCGLVMVIPFFQVSAVKVEPNKLTIETFFEHKELTAHQIKEIKMQSIRGRYGRVTNIVNIVPIEGKNYPLGGFSDGDEIMYGIVVNWWNAYKN